MKQTRSDCKKCGGKNTYTELIDGTMRIWNCYRASCSNKGAQYVGIQNSKTDVSTSVRRKFLLDMSELIRRTIPVQNSPIAMEYIASHNLTRFVIKCLGAYDRSVRYYPTLNRLVFIHEGVAAGKYIGLGKSSVPKWLLLASDNKSVMCFNINRTQSKGDRRILIVEDTVSAAVASTYLTEFNACMALLGTKFTEKHLTECLKYDKLYIALDKDALKPAINLVDKLRLVRKCKLISLDKDIKDMNDDELKKLNNEG